MTSDNGGPAFAMGIPSDHSDHVQKGMSLRDYFAGQSLVAMGDRRFEPSEGKTATQIKAHAAYSMADAMLKERAGQ